MTRRRPRQRVGLGWVALIVGALALGGALLGLRGDGPKPAVPTVTTVAPTTTTAAAACPLGAGRCPDPRLTPGQIEPNARTADDVCPPGTPGRDPRRQLTATQERAVLAAYRLAPGTKPAEFDHLIAYWAGGRSSPSNVWPQRDAADKQRKDTLEGRLARMVCVDHTLDLASARERMRTYWDDPLL